MKFSHSTPAYLPLLDKLTHMQSNPTASLFSLLPVTIIAGLALSLMLFVLPALLNH